MVNQPEIVTVPDISAVELTAHIMRERNLQCSHPHFPQWDYFCGLDGGVIPGRGKRFQVRTKNFTAQEARTLNSDAVRRFFRAEGYEGHVGAFLQWLRVSEYEEKEHLVSIPGLNGYMRGEFLYYPGAYFAEDVRTLTANVDHLVGIYALCVAFKEVKE